MGSHGSPHHSAHHIVPISVLTAVFGVLVLLTVVTVVTARLDLGPMNMPLAIAIASAKAALVVAVFMALLYDNRVNTLVFFIGIVFVMVFLALTLSDTALRGALGIVGPGLMASTPLPADLSVAEHESPDSEAVPALDGSAIFAQFLCSSCHSLDGTAGAGPTLQGIGARQSRGELLASILEPDAVPMDGYPSGTMAATLNSLHFYETVSEAELDALVRYLTTL